MAAVAVHRLFMQQQETAATAAGGALPEAPLTEPVAAGAKRTTRRKMAFNGKNCCVFNTGHNLSVHETAEKPIQGHFYVH